MVSKWRELKFAHPQYYPSLGDKMTRFALGSVPGINCGRTIPRHAQGKQRRTWRHDPLNMRVMTPFPRDHGDSRQAGFSHVCNFV